MQPGEVQGGGVLDDEQDVLVEAPRRGLGGDAAMQRLGGHAAVAIEAIGGRGLAGVAGRLGDRGGGAFERVDEDRGQPLVEAPSGRSAAAAT